MRRALVPGLFVAALLFMTASPALASDSYGQMPGAARSMSHTICAGHGAFGAFGKIYNFGEGIVNLPGYPSGPNGRGASGSSTGAANSALCGSAQ